MFIVVRCETINYNTSQTMANIDSQRGLLKLLLARAIPELMPSCMQIEKAEK